MSGHTLSAHLQVQTHGVSGQDMEVLAMEFRPRRPEVSQVTADHFGAVQAAAATTWCRLHHLTGELPQ